MQTDLFPSESSWSKRVCVTLVPRLGHSWQLLPCFVGSLTVGKQGYNTGIPKQWLDLYTREILTHRKEINRSLFH